MLPRRSLLAWPLVGLVAACDSPPFGPRPTGPTAPPSPATACVRLGEHRFEHTGDPCGPPPPPDDPNIDAEMRPLQWAGPITLTKTGSIAWYQNGLVEWDHHGKPHRLLALRQATTHAYTIVGNTTITPLCDGRLQPWTNGCPTDPLPAPTSGTITHLTTIDNTHYASTTTDGTLTLHTLGQPKPTATTTLPNPDIRRLELQDHTIRVSTTTSVHAYHPTTLKPAGHTTNLPDAPLGWTSGPNGLLAAHPNQLTTAQLDHGITKRHETGLEEDDVAVAIRDDQTIVAAASGELVVVQPDGTLSRRDRPGPWLSFPEGLVVHGDAVHLLDAVDGGGVFDLRTADERYPYESPES